MKEGNIKKIVVPYFLFGCIEFNILRLENLSPEVPVLFLFGISSWINYDCGFRIYTKLKEKSKTKKVNFALISSAGFVSLFFNIIFFIIFNLGHHLYVQNFVAFNSAVISFAKGEIDLYVNEDHIFVTPSPAPYNSDLTPKLVKKKTEKNNL